MVWLVGGAGGDRGLSLDTGYSAIPLLRMSHLSRNLSQIVDDFLRVYF